MTMAVGQAMKALRVVAEGSPLSIRALGRGVAAGIEHQPLLASLGSQTVVDIGANKGQFALAARRALPGAWIVAFEPLPVPASLFRRVFARDPRVRLHEAAIGSADERMTIHIAGRDDSSSLLPISRRQEEYFPGTGKVGEQEVRVSPIAAFLHPADIAGQRTLLKIDVQGYEMEALRGCESILSEVCHIYVECSFVELYVGQELAPAVISFLAERGFGLDGAYNVTYDRKGVAVQADLLFGRRGTSR